MQPTASRSEPPTRLQDRVGGSKDFATMGVGIASLILTHVGKYKSLADAKCVLDWGCGCGRVIVEMMKHVPAERLHGCDIDSEAIEWDKENISGPTFTVVEPYPPTPYRSEMFDVVYGISVLTHLDERTQFLWLKELQRITRPGAILALSVIGENLRATNMPASLAKEFEKSGFASFVPRYSEMFRNFSPEGYYRESYHDLRYIQSKWTRYFELVEFVEIKVQDILILRRRHSLRHRFGRNWFSSLRSAVKRFEK